MRWLSLVVRIRQFVDWPCLMFYFSVPALSQRSLVWICILVGSVLSRIAMIYFLLFSLSSSWCLWPFPCSSSFVQKNGSKTHFYCISEAVLSLLRRFWTSRLSWSALSGSFVSSMISSSSCSILACIFSGVREGSRLVIWLMTWDPSSVGMTPAAHCFWNLEYRRPPVRQRSAIIP